MINRNGASAYSKVNRNMIENLSADFKDFKGYISGEFKDLKATNAELYNHLSTRIPAWVTIIMTAGASILTGIIVWGLSR